MSERKTPRIDAHIVLDVDDWRRHFLNTFTCDSIREEEGVVLLLETTWVTVNTTDKMFNILFGWFLNYICYCHQKKKKKCFINKSMNEWYLLEVELKYSKHGLMSYAIIGFMYRVINFIFVINNVYVCYFLINLNNSTTTSSNYFW